MTKTVRRGPKRARRVTVGAPDADVLRLDAFPVRRVVLGGVSRVTMSDRTAVEGTVTVPDMTARCVR